MYTKIANHLEKFTEVARLLGDGWTVITPYDTYAEFNHTDGRKFGFHVPYNGKFSVSSDLPVTLYPNEQEKAEGIRARVEIGIGESKSAEQIVRDLNRRFFPDFDKSYKLAASILNARETAEARRVAALNTLADSDPTGLAEVVKDYHTEEPKHVSLPYDSSSIYGKFEVSYNSSDFTVELRNLPADVAAQVLAIVAQARKR